MGKICFNGIILLIFYLACLGCKKNEKNPAKKMPENQVAMDSLKPTLVFNYEYGVFSFNKGMKSYGNNVYITVKIDHLAKKIFLEPSDSAWDEFYDPYASKFDVSVSRDYAIKGYTFYWIDSNKILHDLPVVMEKDKNWPAEVGPSKDSTFSSSQLQAFLSELHYNPDQYLDKFLYKNTIPEFKDYFNEDQLNTLSVLDYYTIYQAEMRNSYDNYFLGYQSFPGYYRFFIYWNYEYIRAVDIIHLSKNGKKLFETCVWANGGDGGDYFKTRCTYNSAGNVRIKEEMGSWSDDPEHVEFQKIVESSMLFDAYGKLQNETLKKTYKGNYPFEDYGYN